MEPNIEMIQCVKASDGDTCAVNDCSKLPSKEVTRVMLETARFTELLFHAYFCESHMRSFAKSTHVLVSYILEGKIRGVSPDILS